MTLSEFRGMWERDGYHFIEEERRNIAGNDWILFSLEGPSTLDYGRHLSLIITVAEGGIILSMQLYVLKTNYTLAVATAIDYTSMATTVTTTSADWVRAMKWLAIATTAGAPLLGRGITLSNA